MGHPETKHPGCALQRTTGADWDYSASANILPPTYTDCRRFQEMRLRNRLGLSAHGARIVAALLYGEVSE